jgi:hypothetical protein
LIGIDQQVDALSIVGVSAGHAESGRSAVQKSLEFHNMKSPTSAHCMDAD